MSFHPINHKVTLQRLGILLLFGFCIFLAFNMRSKSDFFSYQSEIWADGSGYYIYLPATFINGFESKNFPDSLDTRMGDGFSLNNGKGIIETKFTYGVALFELPFFVIAHALAPSFNQPRDGFSPIYFKAINICIVFYLFLGLLVLVNYLKLFVTETVAYTTAFIWLVTSQLFYYSIDDPGLSHVYSFTLFATLLYTLNRWANSDYKKRSYFFAFVITLALIIVVRPANTIFLPFLIFWDVSNKTELLERIKMLFNRKNLSILILIVALILLPQMIYWYYRSGSPIIYSYGQESFVNLSSPKISEVLFSPSHGLLFYSPIVLIAFFMSIFFMKSIWHRHLTILLFITITLFFSSWHSWSFGCGFGHRGYIEYQALISLPLALFLSRLFNMRSNTIVFVLFGFFLLAAHNIYMTYHFDGCWQGRNDWDWSEYVRIISNPNW